jgi:hypothetical protein
MNTTEQQNIVLDTPRSNLFVAFFMGISLPIGVLLPFFAGWQLPTLGVSILLIIAGISFLILGWRLLHTPVLIINAEGINSMHPLLRCTVKWDEIHAIYSFRHGTVFAIDLSPAGLVSFFARQGKPIPRYLDITTSQQVLGIQSANLSLPVGHLLAQIREQFADHIEYYHILLDDESEAG